jgi:hypothetical protein
VRKMRLIFMTLSAWNTADKGVTAVPGKSLWAHDHATLQIVKSKENWADISTKNFECSTFEQHGKWFHGVGNYYKDWHHADDPKEEGVTGLEIFGPLDGLMDGFYHSDGWKWVQYGLDKPVVSLPTTIPQEKMALPGTEILLCVIYPHDN